MNLLGNKKYEKSNRQIEHLLRPTQYYVFFKTTQNSGCWHNKHNNLNFQIYLRTAITHKILYKIPRNCENKHQKTSKENLREKTTNDSSLLYTLFSSQEFHTHTFFFLNYIHLC